MINHPSSTLNRALPTADRERLSACPGVISPRRHRTPIKPKTKGGVKNYFAPIFSSPKNMRHRGTTWIIVGNALKAVSSTLCMLHLWGRPWPLPGLGSNLVCTKTESPFDNVFLALSLPLSPQEYRRALPVRGRRLYWVYVYIYSTLVYLYAIGNRIGNGIGNQVLSYQWFVGRV